jgi:hypothetical protein
MYMAHTLQEYPYHVKLKMPIYMGTNTDPKLTGMRNTSRFQLKTAQEDPSEKEECPRLARPAAAGAAPGVLCLYGSKAF